MDLPLRPYQDEAINASLRRSSMLLALVQGSGKTRTAIEIIKVLAEEGSVRGGAIFAPKSLKFQWRDVEIAKWDDSRLALVIDGSSKKQREKLFQAAHKFRYTILNYEALITDWDLVQEYLPRDFIICDEATYIKSLTAKRSKRLKAIAPASRYRFALTGAPVENRPEELFSIMEFVDPTVLGPFHRFDPAFIRRNAFGKPMGFRNLDVLQRTLAEGMFRRSRDDIAEYLPDRIEVEMPARLYPEAQQLHDLIRDDLVASIQEAVAAGFGGFDLLAHYGKTQGDDHGNQAKGQIMARITAMRLLCSHPSLLLASATDFDDEDTKSGSGYASELRRLGLLDNLPTDSSKLDVLMGNLKSIFGENPDAKVVVFASFKPAVRIISEALAAAKYPHTVMTGDTPAQQRQAAINSFNLDSNVRVFLSSDAGAYGVNLDRGTHLFCYDLPWSAGALGQRVARIDRTSSTHSSIYIGYQYAYGTVEHYQYLMLQQKAAIADAFVDGKNIDPQGRLNLTLDSLLNFLTAGPGGMP